ncbi:hypothetical protein GWI33_006932 [Rhynchophorus ferrugineus]|uniref:Uncharacterized protein n=1 Tax=Rhynchophorus ferrugineus TaxID=354439 RepID=A0A834IEB7_RHYFE|nr:hypothetical protein GWI33_006932 [Rhynchophorus ferrugineus]
MLVVSLSRLNYRVRSKAIDPMIYHEPAACQISVSDRRLRRGVYFVWLVTFLEWLRRILSLLLNTVGNKSFLSHCLDWKIYKCQRACLLAPCAVDGNDIIQEDSLPHIKKSV